MSINISDKQRKVSNEHIFVYTGAAVGLPCSDSYIFLYNFRLKIKMLWSKNKKPYLETLLL